MKIRSCEFIISAVSPKQYPEEEIPEIALAGRSNVGKSSLINMLLNRKKMARTSSTPGKTQTINFYKINNEFHFVDLPGYGYAKVSKSSKAEWGKIIETYLTTRDKLVEVVQLIDIRHKPTQQDIQMYNWIRHFGFKGIVVATKLDKIKRSQRQKHISQIRKSLEMGKDDILVPVSSMNREGKEKLWETIANTFIERGFDITVEEAAEI
ncbi:ribosome biogenesis GTP-binding protein YihA/YsxC [Wukongibacter baidiensis]|uniref:ribosome biogenesis GTP-binding protein YihA/YsxC n=1 Tax=Wukongibacter baidiensis TaxID=1723361 RepID=UPI003D7F7522